MCTTPEIDSNGYKGITIILLNYITSLRNVNYFMEPNVANTMLESCRDVYFLSQLLELGQ